MMQTVLNIQSFFEYNGMTLVVFALGMLVGLKITEIIITRNQSKENYLKQKLNKSSCHSKQIISVKYV